MQPVVKTWHLLPHDSYALDRLAKSLRFRPWSHSSCSTGGSVSRTRPNNSFRLLYVIFTPEILPGIPEAATRLWQAIRDGRRVCVYGDYDVDGTTGTAILWQTLLLLGGKVDFYVPHRLEEGYGLHSDALQQIAQTGASVVVTVDCGIGSLAEADEARRLGLELIITDHHEFKEQLPSAAVLVHPRLPGGTYPFGGLSGAGVAFKLAWALCQRASGGEKVGPAHKEFLMDCVALAALGLVADVVPLHDENRIFVRHGLARLREKPSPGMKALLDATELSKKAQLCAEDVSFKLAPRLNAVGRLGCAGWSSSC